MDEILRAKHTIIPVIFYAFVTINDGESNFQKVAMATDNVSRLIFVMDGFDVDLKMMQAKNDHSIMIDTSTKNYYKVKSKVNRRTGQIYIKLRELEHKGDSTKQFRIDQFKIVNKYTINTHWPVKHSKI